MGLSRIHRTHVCAAIDTPAPRGEPRRSRTGRIVVGGPAATLATMGVVMALAACSGHGAPPTSTTTPIPTVAPERLDSILLTEGEAGTIMGKGSTASQIAHQTDTTARELNKPDCLGAYVSGADTVYKDSGYTAISVVRVEDNEDPSHYILQFVVSFASADQAAAFVKSSVPKWKACVGQNITSQSGDQYHRFTLGPLVGDAPKIALLETKEAGNGYACQHALDAVSNVVVDVEACGYDISDQARQAVDNIVAKVTH